MTGAWHAVPWMVGTGPCPIEGPHGPHSWTHRIVRQPGTGIDTFQQSPGSCPGSPLPTTVPAAITVLASEPCERFRLNTGDCTTVRGLSPDARYDSHRYCWPCRIRAALTPEPVGAPA